MEDTSETKRNDDGDVCFDPKLADTILARDLNRMTVDERNIVLDDIHGVRGLRAEEQNPAMIFEALEKMRIAIENIEPKAIMEEARSLESQYVLRDMHFRIRFIRAEEFDAQKAAQRFFDYLQFTRELYGTVALMRSIYFGDLSKDEQNTLREGKVQLLPCRDRTGRRILVNLGSVGDPKGAQYSPSVIRITNYLMHVLSSDETTQKLGCVMVFYGGFSDGETAFLKEPNIKANMRKFIAAFPVRVSAIHFCFPKSRIYQIAAAALTSIAPTILRVRFRLHFGSHTECKYSLMTHGIPGDQLPITSSGRIKTTNHHRWIKFQRAKEDTIQMCLPPFEGVDCPLVTDILIGNAGHNTSFKNNPGNAVYRDIMEAHYHRYEAATDTQQKTRITWKVLEEVKNAGGRILLRDRRGWWTVAGTNKAREKIAHDFRETRKKKQPAPAAAAPSSKRRAVCDDDTAIAPTTTSSSYIFVDQPEAAMVPSDQQNRCLGRQPLGEITSGSCLGDSNSDSGSNDNSDTPGCLRTFQ